MDFVFGTSLCAHNFYANFANFFVTYRPTTDIVHLLNICPLNYFLQLHICSAE